MDAISQSRLADASPALIFRLRQLDVSLQSQGVDFRLTEVVRSWAKQADDFAAKESNAKPGYSWHQYGFAADGCPMVNGKPDWDAAGRNWVIVLALLPGLGLFSGKNFTTIKGDDDHIQLAEIPESPTAEDVQTLTDGGMTAVWEKYFPGDGGADAA